MRERKDGEILSEAQNAAIGWTVIACFSILCVGATVALIRWIAGAC